MPPPCRSTVSSVRRKRSPTAEASARPPLSGVTAPSYPLGPPHRRCTARGGWAPRAARWPIEARDLCPRRLTTRRPRRLTTRRRAPPPVPLFFFQSRARWWGGMQEETKPGTRCKGRLLRLCLAWGAFTRPAALNCPALSVPPARLLGGLFHVPLCRRGEWGGRWRDACAAPRSWK